LVLGITVTDIAFGSYGSIVIILLYVEDIIEVLGFAEIVNCPNGLLIPIGAKLFRFITPLA
jgi:hypothetical protein